MGYFPNGSSGDRYEQEWCENCLHGQGEEGNDCAVLVAHALRNYDDCNDKESPLHVLIPRDKYGGNLKCEMFHRVPEDIFKE